MKLTECLKIGLKLVQGRGRVCSMVVLSECWARLLLPYGGTIRVEMILLLGIRTTCIAYRRFGSVALGCS